MAENFQVGQRVISEAEPELGLGSIVHTEINRLEVDFPALEEPRLYARRDAPLKRLILYPGDSFPHSDGRQLMVEAVERHAELLIYLAVDEHGEQQVVPEADIAKYMPINQPRQRLLTGQLDGNRWFDLRIRSLEAIHRLAASGFQGLVGARAALLGHQLYVANSATQWPQCRVLLSDEVGLGKTIEAGLILQRLIHRQGAKRALIIVPEALQHQWLVEMLRRFNIRCKLIDDGALPDIDDPRDLMAAIFDQSEAPMIDDHSHWIVPIERLAFDDELVGELYAADFDCLIVDEAHRLQWHADSVSTEYVIVEGLAAEIPNVLLLTATPTQWGQDGYFARLKLLDPIRYSDLASFEAEQSRYAEVAALAEPLIEAKPLDEDNRQALMEVLEDAHSQQLLAQPALNQEAQDLLLNRLVDRLGTGRAVYRNTRRSVGGFAKRSLHMALCEPAPWRDDDQAWWREDRRVQWLIETLRSDHARRYVLICETAETALELSEAIRVLAGIPLSVFHEGMSIVECDRAAAYFADDEDGAQILLCSSIGAEGRNFQFVSDLIIFDLPKNPDALEQMIGRIDRIGQDDEVKIHVPVIEASAGHHIARWHHEVLNGFEKSCAYGALVMAQFADQLDAAVHDTQAIQALIDQAKPVAEQIALDDLQGRDRLLEWHSMRPEKAQALAEAIDEFETTKPVWPWFERAADCFGLEIEELGADRHFVKIGDHAEHNNLQGLAEDGAVFAATRKTATAREDLEFLSWEHPLVEQLLEEISVGDRGKACLASLSDPGLRPGEIFIESYFVPELRNANTNVLRALPAGLYRNLSTLAGLDITARVAPAWLRQRVKGIKKVMARQITESNREQFKDAVMQVEAKAADIEGQWREQVAATLQQDQQEALSRAQALGASSEDIAALKSAHEADMAACEQLVLRFEALRIILTH